MLVRVLAFVVALCATLPAQAGGHLPLSIPFLFENNQILVKVGINTAAPAWFILDSGASGCIVDTAVARRMHLKVEGQTQGTGAGKGTVTIRFTPNVTYRLPGASLTVARSYVIDFSGQRTLLGRDIAGILGYEFFLPYVVALDFDAGMMTLSDPASYTPRQAAAAIPFRLTPKTPHITIRTKIAGAEPVETDVLVDSGSGDSVDVDSFAQSPQRLEVVGGVGLGQEFRTVLGRGEWAEIGPYRLAAPTGVTGGVALIGNETLRRFDVVFDYAHLRMFLTPNSHFADPFVYDASGLDLRWSDDGKRFVAHDVPPGTPAADAGIHTNDEILTINNQPADRFSIAQVNRMLSKAGDAVLLGVRKGGKVHTVALRLRKRL